MMLGLKIPIERSVNTGQTGWMPWEKSKLMDLSSSGSFVNLQFFKHGFAAIH